MTGGDTMYIWCRDSEPLCPADRQLGCVAIPVLGKHDRRFLAGLSRG